MQRFYNQFISSSLISAQFGFLQTGCELEELPGTIAFSDGL